MNQIHRHSTPVDAFKACFSGVAAFLGRPSAHTVLFTWLPLGPGAITFEEVELVASRAGIEARTFTRADFARHRVELPAILFMVGRPPVALLSEEGDSEFITVPQESGRTTFSRGEILEAEISQIVGFSLTYANT